ncbi:hypothetical protein K474DRAFT_258964 [Panus rudis PR-1116 ss-1]|nr:hypothetical protein K474DRAFT_258964 [Panus rudis PR-1116 ss-1]
MLRSVSGLVSTGGKTTPASAAFPAGLPEGLSETSDVEPGSAINTCTCKSGAGCNCCTPRTSASRTKRREKEKIISSGGAHRDTIQHDSDTHATITRPAGLVAMAHSGAQRPLLPRPSPQRGPSPVAPTRGASPSSLNPNNRHQTHFSPYARAYEYAHGVDVMPSPPDVSAEAHHPPTPNRAESSRVISNNPPQPASDFDFGLFELQEPLFLCSCGDTCACPGCAVHRGPSYQPSASDSCGNPGACFACANCGLFDVPSPDPPSIPSSTMEVPQDVEQWLQHLPSIVADYNTTIPSTFESQQLPTPMTSAQQQRQQQFNPMWQSYALWGSLQNQTIANPAPQECCGGRCKCPAGLCSCAADCCGCCQGCTCPTCDHDDAHRTVTFAVSGERAPCCGSDAPRNTVAQPVSAADTSHHRPPLQQQPPHRPNVNAVGSSSRIPANTVPTNPYGDWSPALNAPRTSASRTSSDSSRASSPHSQTSSHGSVHSAPAASTSNGVSSNAPVRSCCSSMQSMNTSSQPNVSSLSFSSTSHRQQVGSSSSASASASSTTSRQRYPAFDLNI